MLVLRVVLFAGLVLHKLVWELLKRKDNPPVVQTPVATSPIKILVKWGKVALLGFFMFQTLFLDVLPILDNPLYLRPIGVALFVAGLATAVSGRLQLGDNWANLEDYQAFAKRSLVNTGIYRFIRHPIYAGDILMLLGLELALNSWLVLLVTAPLAVVLKQIAAEEALLARTFPGYAEYRQNTKRLIPFVL